MSKSKYIKSIFPHKLGNKKIGTNTIIFSIGTAHNCYSSKMGYCQVKKNKCYAYRDEKRYQNALRYRMKQQKAFKNLSVSAIVAELKKTIKKHNIKEIRFNESGDIRNQKELEKIISIAIELKPITIYGFTANRELSFKNLPSNLVINGSGFMIDNEFTIIDKNDKNNYDYECKSDCSICNYCKSKKNLKIKVREH